MDEPHPRRREGRRLFGIIHRATYIEVGPPESPGKVPVPGTGAPNGSRTQNYPSSGYHERKLTESLPFLSILGTTKQVLVKGTLITRTS